jgi:hypothetical protein
MSNFLGKIVDQGKDILQDPSKISSYVEDPSKLLNVGLDFIGQDVLDSLIDKVLEACRSSMTDAGIDPLPMDDITIPYSLDKMTGACASFIKRKDSPLGELLLALCACVAKNMNIEGDLLLRNGCLSGLSQLTRSGPTKLEVANNKAVLTVGLGLTNLESPFEASASLASPDFKPQVKAVVEKVGIHFGVEVPLSGEQTSAGSFEFDPPLDELTVDVDVELAELGELEPVLKPLVINPVKKKIIEILKGQVKELIDKKIQQFIPGIHALT